MNVRVLKYVCAIDRTPQPFSLLDEVLNRLAIPRDKLSGLYEWKLSSVTLSSERVREVASCCCSNVSIRLPQSGEVTLLPLATLREIEAALRKQGSSAWLVSSASAGTAARPSSAMSGAAVKVKKEPLEGLGSCASSSSSSSSSAAAAAVATASASQVSVPPSSAAGKNISSGMGYRHCSFSSISGSNANSYNSSSISSTSGTATMPVSSPLSHSDKPESVRRSDALSRVPILTKMEQQAGGFSSSGAGQHLFSSDLLTSSSGTFRSKQVLQPARDLFHPLSSTSTTSSTTALKSKASSSAFSLASAVTSFTTTTTSALGGAISSSIPSSTSFFSKHTKLKTSSSFPFSSSTSSSFSSSLGLSQQKSGSYQSLPSGLNSSWSSPTSSSSSSSVSFSSSSTSSQQQHQHHHHQGLKKSSGSDHHRGSHHQQQQQQQPLHQHVKQQQQQQQRSTPPSHGSSAPYSKGTQSTSSKEGRSSVGSASSAQRKPKKDDPEGSWLNTPMFSDDSSSSPFHTSIDFDSENSD
ncbi:hypothetical protein ElyMa_004346100 [Elysia marginata]|uniref:Uncharacterized protein n=1 Tax=Elysia marginata TaxID=1093978 RepID=A0AAV4H350_9GAST|nr:hypothetical protein ElyMa_004346100 [Elysia marginata]